MVQNNPIASAADLADRWRIVDGGSGLSLFEVSNLELSGPKGLYVLGLAATRAAARFIPFGGAGRGPGTGPRFEYKVYQKVKSLTFWETLP